MQALRNFLKIHSLGGGSFTQDIYLERSFSIIRKMSHTHSLTHNFSLAFRPHIHCLWIDFDVLYGVAYYNLIRKPFLMA